jgi:hypothetical protein
MSLVPLVQDAEEHHMTEKLGDHCEPKHDGNSDFTISGWEAVIESFEL